MEQMSYNDLKTHLEWSQMRVNELEAQVESWRTKAQIAEKEVRSLQSKIDVLNTKLAHSLPIYDPDEIIDK